jgi:putative ABC transport system permease protein
VRQLSVVLSVIALLVVWMSCTRTGRQTWSLTKMGIATLPQRAGSASVVVIGIAGVVGVLVAILAMSAGFEQTLHQTGSEDTAIVLQAGQRLEVASALDHASVALISQAPHILRSASDQPLVSAAQLTMVSLPKRKTGLDASVAMRGVGERIWEIWPQVRIIAGRRLQSGLPEMVVGKGAHEKFAGLDVGSTVTLDGQSWRVVGVFDSGDAHASEIWADGQVVSSAYRREGMVNSLVVRLTDGRAFAPFKAALERDPRLDINVQTTRHYYRAQSETIARMIRIVGISIGLIMAVGAIFSALNATYMTIASRAREVATLRAIGFQHVTVIVSLLLETMLLATLGGALGAVITWMGFDGLTVSTLGSSGQIVFPFDVSSGLLVHGLQWALAIGFIGGLFPAIRAACQPIVIGLRES